MTNFTIRTLADLNEDVLRQLSYPSNLGKSLKNTLRKFDENEIIEEVFSVREFYLKILSHIDLQLEHRIKSVSSSQLKYKRYFPNREVFKVYNDLLGIRVVVNDYAVIDEYLKLHLIFSEIADLRNGKVEDDGYRGIHLYYQESKYHYPIEIQINTNADRKLNDWLHSTIYKQTEDLLLGKFLREQYEHGNIKNKTEFDKVVDDYVLFSGKKI
jgi:Region found in RelA / SpoT proteins.